MENIPSNYNIAIRKDGKLFRIAKHLDYSDLIPEDQFCIQYGEKPCAFRRKYFDVHGQLKRKYWLLQRIMEKEVDKILDDRESVNNTLIDDMSNCVILAKSNYLNKKGEIKSACYKIVGDEKIFFTHKDNI